MPINSLLSAFFSVFLLQEALRGFFCEPFPKALDSVLNRLNIVHGGAQMPPPVCGLPDALSHSRRHATLVFCVKCTVVLLFGLHPGSRLAPYDDLFKGPNYDFIRQQFKKGVRVGFQKKLRRSMSKLVELLEQG
jgi:hypothetical protein